MITLRTGCNLVCFHRRGDVRYFQFMVKADFGKLFIGFSVEEQDLSINT